MYQNSNVINKAVYLKNLKNIIKSYLNHEQPKNINFLASF